MGAISRKRYRHVRSHGPSRASKLRRVFCCLERNCFEFPAQAGTGDPDPGARAGMRALESVATKFVLHFGFAAARGATNAGGEDFGYFFCTEAVKHPPSIDRTVESVRQDGCVAGCGEA